jgi:hypothetical protein
MLFVIYYTDGTSTIMYANKSVNFSFNTYVSELGKSIDYMGNLPQSDSLFYYDLDTFQIEKGTTATTYEPYTSDKISFEETLRSLPNGTQDEIVEIDGKYFKNEKISEANEELAEPQLIDLTDNNLVTGDLQSHVDGSVYNTADVLFSPYISFDVDTNQSARIDGLAEGVSRNSKAIGILAERLRIYDFTLAPGPKTLLKGDRDAGFFGYVSSADLITGDALAADLGLTAGTSMYSDGPWIKYIFQGQIKFTPLKGFRHSISHNAIYNVGAVYGTEDEGTLPPNGRLGTQLSILASDNSINTTGDFLNASAVIAAVGETVKLTGWDNGANNGDFTVDSITSTKIVLSGGTLIDESLNKGGKVYNTADMVTQNAKTTVDGVEYRVELMQGASNDPLDSYADSDKDSVGADNEWNAIILPLHERAKLQDWAFPQYAGTTEYWGTDLTDEDLRTHNKFGVGSYTWCQEVRDDSDTFRRVIRGHSGASYSYAYLSWYTYSTYVWRPVIKVIG